MLAHMYVYACFKDKCKWLTAFVLWFLIKSSSYQVIPSANVLRNCVAHVHNE